MQDFQQLVSLVRLAGHGLDDALRRGPFGGEAGLEHLRPDGDHLRALFAYADVREDAAAEAGVVWMKSPSSSTKRSMASAVSPVPRAHMTSGATS